jgi:hypothetical protein
MRHLYLIRGNSNRELAVEFGDLRRLAKKIGIRLAFGGFGSHNNAFTGQVAGKEWAAVEIPCCMHRMQTRVSVTLKSGVQRFVLESMGYGQRRGHRSRRHGQQSAG